MTSKIITSTAITKLSIPPLIPTTSFPGASPERKVAEGPRLEVV
jgi:hypothetical protein